MGDIPKRSHPEEALAEERRRNRVKGIRREDIDGSGGGGGIPTLAYFSAEAIVGLSANPSYANITQWNAVSPNITITGSEDDQIIVPSGTWLMLITVRADPQGTESPFDTNLYGELTGTELRAVDNVKNGSRITGQTLMGGGTYQGQVGYADAVDAADRTTEIAVVGIQVA